MHQANERIKPHVEEGRGAWGTSPHKPHPGAEQCAIGRERKPQSFSLRSVGFDAHIGDLTFKTSP